jgi:hypothetical protein
LHIWGSFFDAIIGVSVGEKKLEPDLFDRQLVAKFIQAIIQGREVVMFKNMKKS